TIPLHSTDSTYAPILGHSRSPILGRHPDQSYRLFRYTPQIPRTLRSSAILDCRSSAILDCRSSAILDCRSSAATPINHIDYSVTLHRFFHSRSPIRGRYERA
ncbi:uncharacterized protein BDCG_17480, partial [Blastomyces dermatitidis ER-3]